MLFQDEKTSLVNYHKKSNKTEFSIVFIIDLLLLPFVSGVLPFRFPRKLRERNTSIIFKDFDHTVALNLSHLFPIYFHIGHAFNLVN